MTDHTEYRPIRMRHREALIRQEPRRLAAVDGRPRQAANHSRSGAGSSVASSAARIDERLSVQHSPAGVLTGSD